MPKKNKKPKVIDFGQIEETSKASDHLTESAAAENEAVESNPAANITDETPVDEGMTSGEESQDEASMDSESAEETADDILDDVRRSLIEDEEHTHEKETKWWKRIGKGSRKDKTEVVKNEPVEEVAIPIAPPTENMVEMEAPDAELDPIDELIGMLESEAENNVEKTPAVNVEEKAPEPEKIIDVEELKKHAFAHREEEKDDDISEVRAIALGGDDEEVFVEVDSAHSDPFEERLKAFENALKPYRSYINLTIAFLGVVMAVIASILLFNLYKASLPAKPAEEISNLPYPTSVSLPGGWSFSLAKGSLVDGQWNPRGAEWLEGTEVCRWVALPWSRQLEAVVRTLNSKDKVDLVMSNQDRLTYEVDSIHQMSPEEMQKLDSNSPCLLIVLAEPGAEKRWVLTALP